MKKLSFKAITFIMAFIFLSSALSVFAFAAGDSFTDEKTGVVVTAPDGWAKGPDLGTDKLSPYSWNMVSLYNYTGDDRNVVEITIYDMWSDLYSANNATQRTREEFYSEDFTDSNWNGFVNAVVGANRYEKVNIGKYTYIKAYSDVPSESDTDSDMYFYLKDGYVFYFSYFSTNPDAFVKDFEKILKDADYSKLPEAQAKSSAAKIIIPIIIALAVIGTAVFFAIKYFKNNRNNKVEAQPMPPQAPSYNPEPAPDPVVYIPPQQPAYNPRDEYTKVFSPQPAHNPREDYTKVFTPQSQPTYTVKAEPIIEEAPVKTYDIPISQAPVAIPYQVALNDESDDFEDIFSSPEMAQTANIKPAVNPFVKTDEPEKEAAEENTPAEPVKTEEAPAPVVIPKPVKYCPQCDKTFPSGFFCPTCGNLLENK